MRLAKGLCLTRVESKKYYEIGKFMRNKPHRLKKLKVNVTREFC